MVERPVSVVTGAAGLIGSHLCRHLLGEGHIVHAVDDLSVGHLSSVPDHERLWFHEFSVEDPERVRDLFRGSEPDFLYHLAAYAAEHLSHFVRRFNYRNNLIASANLVNEAVRYGVEHVTFTSSIAVYGDQDPPFSEDDRPSPEDPYAIAKYAVEQDLEAAANLWGLDYTVFRPHNVYGEYQDLAGIHRNVVAIFMNQIMRGEPLTIFGDGEQTRAFTYIGDVAPVIAAAPLQPGASRETFNVGGDTTYTVNELARAVRWAMGVPDHPIEYLPKREEPDQAYSHHAKVWDVFSTGATVPLEEGLRRTAEWAKGVGPQEPESFGTVEITEGMPPSWRETVEEETDA